MREKQGRDELLRERIAGVVELLELGDPPRPAVKHQAGRTLEAYCRLMESEFALGTAARPRC